MTGIDRLDDLGLAGPQQDVASAARADLGQRGAPRPAADHAQPIEAHAFTPAPRTFSASGSSGQRARAGASSGRSGPAMKRSAPAQAIIAALSVHSQPGGTLNWRPWSAASCCERRSNRAVGGHATGHDQGGRVAAFERKPGPIDQAVDDRLLEGGGNVGGAVFAGCDRALNRALEAGEGEVRLARADQWPRQRNRLGIAVCCELLDRGPARIGQPEQLGRLVERLSRCVVDGRREPPIFADCRAPRATGNGRPTPGAAGTETPGPDRPAAG